MLHNLFVEPNGNNTSTNSERSDQQNVEPIAPTHATSGSLLQSPFLWAFLVGIITLSLIRPFLHFEPDPPPILYALPPFELTTASGDSFGSSDLAGAPYIASFFFTNCPSICPVLMRQLALLADRYEKAGINKIRMISISVDPETDTPEALTEYGLRVGAQQPRWRLLTGDTAYIRKLAIDGFKVPVGSPEKHATGLYEIAHTGKLVLVDAHGNVRGYYDSTEQGIDEIFHRSQHVQKEHGSHHTTGGHDH